MGRARPRTDPPSAGDASRRRMPRVAEHHTWRLMSGGSQCQPACRGQPDTLDETGDKRQAPCPHAFFQHPERLGRTTCLDDQNITGVQPETPQAMDVKHAMFAPGAGRQAPQGRPAPSTKAAQAAGNQSQGKTLRRMPAGRPVTIMVVRIMTMVVAAMVITCATATSRHACEGRPDLMHTTNLERHVDNHVDNRQGIGRPSGSVSCAAKRPDGVTIRCTCAMRGGRRRRGQGHAGGCAVVLISKPACGGAGFQGHTWACAKRVSAVTNQAVRRRTVTGDSFVIMAIPPRGRGRHQLRHTRFDTSDLFTQALDRLGARPGRAIPGRPGRITRGSAAIRNTIHNTIMTGSRPQYTNRTQGFLLHGTTLPNMTKACSDL